MGISSGTLGFTNAKGYLREELVTTEAEEIAQSLSSVSTAQLRAFFNQDKGYEK